jgi:uncharacterized membrane protein
MGISALVGVGALFTFVTVTMPDSVSRLVIGIFLGAGAVFLVCATSAVFAAARDTYRDSSSKTDDA